MNKCDEALRHFHAQVQEEIVREQQSPQLNPQQVRAIAHLKAIRNAGMTHAHERNALDQAIELIKRGRFQSLPKDINNLYRKIKKTPMPPARQLDALLQIINKYLSPENTLQSHDIHFPRNEESEGQDRRSPHTSVHHSPLEGESESQDRRLQHTSVHHSPLEGESESQARSAPHTSVHHSPLEGESESQARRSPHTSVHHSPLEGESESQARSAPPFRWGETTNSNNTPRARETTRNFTTPKIIISQSYV